MKLDYVPLLRVMRELHSIPRGQPPDFNGVKRFRQFVRTIFPRKKNGKIDENAVWDFLTSQLVSRTDVAGAVQVTA
jgi:hypothetical protein